jgi:hypothetical protein
MILLKKMKKVLLILLIASSAVAEKSFFDFESYSQSKVLMLIQQKINQSHNCYHCDNVKQQIKTKSPDFAIFTTQTVAGGLAGIMTAVGTGSLAGLAYIAFGDFQNEDALAKYIFIVTGSGYAGYLFGSGSAVYIIGKKEGLQGFYWNTLLGSLAGAVAGYLGYQSDKGAWGFYIGPPLCATIAFNLSK